jgi:hypothetical protein
MLDLSILIMARMWYNFSMTVDYFTQLFGALNVRAPFRPFTVELAGGHRFEVDHPQAMVVRDGVTVHLQSGSVPVWFDHESVTQIVGDIADTTA